MEQTIVLSLGGSLVNPGRPDDQYVLSLIRILRSSKHNFGIVVGGGKLARAWADKVRSEGGNEFEADEAAIRATKKNAQFVIDMILKTSNKKDEVNRLAYDSFDAARRGAKKYKFVVMGGTIPGITTDSDSVLLAECINAKRVINLSNIDAVYSDNPVKNPHAKRYKKMSFDQMIELAGRSDLRKAGTHFVFDFLACKLIARSKIETHFVHGKNFLDLRHAVEGRNHSGTVIKEK
jgi:uridylate kinase